MTTRSNTTGLGFRLSVLPISSPTLLAEMAVAHLLATALLALVLLATPTIAGPSRYHAALCISRHTRCNTRLARLTRWYCRPGIEGKKQSMKCRRLACAWCYIPSKASTKMCVTNPLRWMCRRLSGSSIPQPTKKPVPSKSSKPVPPSPAPSKAPPPPSPMPSKEPTTKPPTTEPPTTSKVPTETGAPPQRPCPRNIQYVDPKCVWHARGNEVVIDLGKVYPPSGWTCVRRGDDIGWIYKKHRNLGIDPKGAGRMCFRILPKNSGKYYFTALSYAPHNTEHNDMWVQSPDLGFELWKWGTFWRTAGTNEWLKAYQNNGIRGLIDQLKHKDFDGHRFLIPNVEKGKIFRVCISGRSFKYEVFRVFVMKCFGNNCQGVPRHGLHTKVPTQCKVV